ncbi:cupin domain-containing protein [Pseudanabaena sp. UWO311]|uniref:cupin domain-containing protein n=1 Tax=Pseudanabaena sp. UWO311 TaxID=2487337 RepID=UPI001158B2F2|nr:cupin domain-containing protein [Pseudanabaena sp. UWO311]TYQ29019.1 cupin domain-containing protein [Pseudanabaena sp. UWO311]
MQTKYESIEMKSPLSIISDFVVLSPDKKANTEHFNSGLYERLNAKYNGFAGHELISCHEFTSDWTSWEVHPYGDEIVVLLSGTTTFLLKIEGDEVRVILSYLGQYVIVPKGVWHTAKTQDYVKLLFITPGQDTQNKAI